MKYDASQEKQVEHGLISKNDKGEYFRVARVIPGSDKVESIDIRLFYTDVSGMMRPTQKGVRVHSEAVADVVMALLKAMTPDERIALTEKIAETDELHDIDL